MSLHMPAEHGKMFFLIFLQNPGTALAKEGRTVFSFSREDGTVGDMNNLAQVIVPGSRSHSPVKQLSPPR